ncbi:MAG: HAMP domain-containing histidine kinase [Eubacterium sp.]|nr:HAMP domain-containing histidine kinase [Eubacterium sp.]
MNRERKQNRDDFRHFRTKIFFSTVLLVIIAVGVINFLYSGLFFGRFANWMVAVLQNLFMMDYYEALLFYQRVFRNHMTLIFMVAIIVVFLIIFYIYLNWFTKYFREINRGIDTLLTESAGEVSLSPELREIEKKINTIKNTLEKRKIEAQLAEQRKNDMVVYLAHDLKTPLASVIGYLNLLNDEKQISEELREKYLSISLEKAERLEDLINEFFEIAKYNLSNITLQYSSISLKFLLEQLLYEFQPMLQEKNIACNLNMAEDITLKCDADKMQRVFGNLLRNAVIYSFRGTTITIAVAVQDGCVNLRFTNFGNTIPKEKLDHIFEQFYRLDAARNTESGGAGLGLAIAKQIVELHHGKITAKSENETIEFEVSFPLL